MRTLLSPTSRINSQVYFPPSPSNKSYQSMCLDDSFSEITNSQLLYSQPVTGPSSHRQLSFKKLKQQKIKQKNEKGRIVKQYIYKNNQGNQNKKRQRLKTLDDAKTIQSKNSPRSSVSTCKKRRIEQSIIIRCGKDIQNEQDQFTNNIPPPETPSFKRRNTYTQQIQKKNNDFLKPISSNPDLIKSVQTGLIFHYQITKKPRQFYNRLTSINHEGILQLYSTVPIESCKCSLTLLIYQPYTQVLSQKLLQSQRVDFGQLISYMTQIIKILSYLKDFCIYPEIEPTTIVLSNSAVKIKIRYQEQQERNSWVSNQRQVIRECGYYFSSLLKSLYKYKIVPSSKQLRKVTGIDINKRIKFQNLMDQFIRFQQYTLHEAYLKLETIDY